MMSGLHMHHDDMFAHEKRALLEQKSIMEFMEQRILERSVMEFAGPCALGVSDPGQ